MARNNLVKAFNYDVSSLQDSFDLNVFKDKDELDSLRRKVLERVGDLSFKKEKITKEVVERIIDEVIEGHNLTNLERNHLYNIVNDEINGYGPLSELLKDDSVEEIMVNAYNEIYTLVNGNMIKDNFSSFINEEHYMRTIKKMLSHTDIRLDKESIIETTLPDGSNLNIIMPPVSLTGPIVTIKKFNPVVIDMNELIKLGTLTSHMARFLETAAKASLNILVCGRSKSGKTSLLTSLVNLESDSTRIVCVSTNEELMISKPNTIYLNKDEDNKENIMNTVLTLHPNTIVINNIDDDLITDVIDVIQDDNFNILGGFLSNNALEVINTLEGACIDSKKFSAEGARDILYNSIDLIVTITKLADKKHRITSICEFNKNAKNEIVLKEIFSYKDSDGFLKHNYTPRVYKKIKSQNIDDIDDIFLNNQGRE